MKRLLYIYAFLVAAMGTRAQSFDRANALYDSARYEQAARMYRETAAEYPVSAEIWYNLGNAYYQADAIGFSIAAYRKALKLAPGDADIQHNLDMAVARSSDKMAPAPPTFLVRQTDGVARFLSPAGWAWLTLFFAATGLGAFLVYVFAPGRHTKKWGLTGSVLTWMLAFGFATLAAHRYYYALDSHAVVVSTSAEILAEPTETATRLLLLNEGATIRYKKHEGTWIHVELPNGAQGFVEAEKVEII